MLLHNWSLTEPHLTRYDCALKGAYMEDGPKNSGNLLPHTGRDRVVRDWLKDMPQDDRRSLGHDIGLVEFGWPVGMPLCRSLGGGLWEVEATLRATARPA